MALLRGGLLRDSNGGASCGFDGNGIGGLGGLDGGVLDGGFNGGLSGLDCGVLDGGFNDGLNGMDGRVLAGGFNSGFGGKGKVFSGEDTEGGSNGNSFGIGTCGLGVGFADEL